MRWLRQSRDGERGATAVLVALVMIPLIAAAALVIDVGALYAEKAQLQNGADASAMAIARSCVKSESTCTSAAAVADGESYAADNANDTYANWLSAPNIQTSANYVEVLPSTLGRDGASTSVNHPFAAAVGLDDVWTVDAYAKAIWGGLVSGPTLPLAISECELARHNIPVAGETGAPFLLLSAGTIPPCPGGIPGGFGWLSDSDTTKCEVNLSATATVPSTSGNNIQGTGCENMTEAELAAVVDRIGCNVGTTGSITERFFDCLLGATILVPLYGAASTSSGPGGGPTSTYTITRFVAFHVTGYKINLASSGGNTTKYLAGAPTTPTFSGSDRGLRGSFVRYVSLDEAFELGGDPGTGLGGIRLVG